MTFGVNIEGDAELEKVGKKDKPSQGDSKCDMVGQETNIARPSSERSCRMKNTSKNLSFQASPDRV